MKNILLQGAIFFGVFLFIGLFASQAHNGERFTPQQGETTPEVTPEITPEITPEPTPPADVQTGPVFIVNTTDEAADDGFCSDSHCALGEAIIAANTYNGAATIQLSPLTYTFTETQSDRTALPVVTGDFTIEGNGATLERLETDIEYLPELRFLYNEGTLALNNLTLRNGYVFDATGLRYGGAIYHASGDLTLNNVTLEDNTSQSEGGGIFVNAGTATINDSILRRNTGTGGALSVASGATVVIDNSEIYENSNMGIYGRTGSNLTVMNSALVHNIGSYGGAIRSRSQLTIINSTIAYNTATNNGGGVYVGTVSTDAELNIIHSTFAQNQPTAFYADTADYDITIQHSVFANSNFANCEIGGEWSLDSQYNIVTDSTCTGSAPDTTTLHNANAVVGGLGYYGQSTRIIPLIPGSAAIDLIPAENCTQAADQHGIMRPVGTGCDSGAQEFIGSLTNADLSLTQSVPVSSVEFDDVLTYTITVTNNSSNNVDNVAVYSPIEDGQVFVSAFPQVGNYTPMSGIWEIGTVAAGTSVVMQLNLRLDENDNLLLSHFSEIVSSSANDPDSIPNNGITSEDDYDDSALTIVCTPRTLTIADGDVDGLIDAFEKSNNSPCPASPLTIELATNGTYTLDTLYDDIEFIRRYGLPPVTREIIIEGNNATIERRQSATDFRLIYVTETGSLILNQVVMRGGLANRGVNANVSGSRGGAIYNLGVLTVNNSKFVNNMTAHSTQSVALGAAILNGGALVLENSHFVDNDGGSQVSHQAGTLTINATIFEGGVRGLDSEAVGTVSNSLFTGASYIAIVHYPFPITETDILTVNNSVVINNFRGIEGRSNTSNNIILNGTILQSNGGNNCELNPQGMYNISDDDSCDSLTDPSNLHNTDALLTYFNDGQGDIAYFPLVGSPAIDAIPASDCPTSSDVYGLLRPTDTDGDSTVACEIGMVELVRTGLAINKIVDNPTPTVGDDVTFTVTVINQGGFDAHSLIVSDVIPPELVFLSTTASRGAYDYEAGRWTIGNLAVSESVTLDVAVHVSGGVVSNVTNTATLDSSTAISSLTDNDSATVTVTCPVSYDWVIPDGDSVALIAAILTANNETCFPGTNTIELATDGTYSLSLIRDEANGAVALPSITSDIIINGNGATIERALSGSQMRLFNIASSADLTLNDTLVQNGSLVEDGGAIYNEGTLTINGGSLINNASDNRGGALLNSGTLNIDGTTVENNLTDKWGGGIAIDSGTVNISNATLHNNRTVLTTVIPGGGAIEMNGGVVTITDSTFTNNSVYVSPSTAHGGGAAIRQTDGTLEIYRTTFNTNRVTGQAWGGAILLKFTASALIEDSTFINNYSASGGGAIRLDDGSLTINRSTFAYNSSGYGGGLSLSDVATISNSTFSQNTGTYGGAVYASGANVIIDFTTFYGNYAPDGGGIDNHAVMSVSNSIFAENSESCDSTILSGGGNVTDDATCSFNEATDLMNVDVRVNPTLRDNGGFTQTHALLSGSPAIDAVSTASCSPIIDQRNLARPQNTNCDAGAYEWDASIPQLTAPTNLIFSTITDTSFTIQWADNTPYETGYVVERYDGFAWVAVASLAADTTQFVDDGGGIALSCDVEYSYRVRAERNTNDDWTAYSNTVSSYLYCELEQPTNLVASSTVGDITLAWDENNITETAHEIERSTDNINWTNIGIVAANVTSFVDETAACDTTYHYRVRAYRAADAAYSNYSDVLTTAITICLQDGPIFTVNTTGSGSDTYCEVTHCTVREAFLAAQAVDDSTIQIPAGTYPVANVDEMTITRSNVRVEGVDAATTIINFNSQYPGIIVDDNASATIANLTIQGSTTANVAANSGATLTVEDSIVRDAEHTGIRGDYADVTVLSSQVIDNENDDDGAGIRVEFGTLTVRDTYVANNFLRHTGQVQYGAGIYKYGPGDVIIENTTVHANKGGYGGHGIGLIHLLGDENTYRIANTTVTGQSPITDEGIHIYAPSGTPIVEHVTITNNYEGIAATSNVILKHSIVAGNTTNIVPTDAPTDGGYNITSGDPLLHTLNDNGGYTPTHALLFGSPALDAIPTIDCTLTNDQRGIARPDGSGCDIGAFEMTGSVFPVGDPLNLVATAQSTSTILLTWEDKATDETAYYVERSLSGANSWTTVATLAADETSYLDTVPNCVIQFYDYRVQAFRSTDGASSAYSNIATEEPIHCPPEPPENLTLTGVGDDIVEVRWTNAESNLRVEYFRSLDGGITWPNYLLLSLNNNTGVNDGTIVCGQEYTYRLRNYRPSDGLYSDYTASQSITLTCPPPTNLQAVGVDETTIDLTWEDNLTHETNYYVERSSDGGTNWVAVGSVGANVTTYSDIATLCNISYEYRVQGYVEASDTLTAYSPTVSITSPCPNPDNLSVGEVTTNSIEITWDDPLTSETEYRVERSINGVDWVEIASLAQDSTTYTDTALECEREFMYRVRAYRSSDDYYTEYTNELTAATDLCPIPRPPLAVSAVGASPDDILITWVNDNLSDVQYKIERGNGSTNQWLEAATVVVGIQSYVDNIRVCDRSYDYRMRAFRPADGMYSPYANIVAGTTLPCPSLNPANPPTATSIERTTTTLNIPADISGEFTSYTIERKIVPEVAPLNFEVDVWYELTTLPVTGTVFEDSNLTCDTTYAYRLRGYRAEDDTYSPYSAETQIITAPCPIPFTHTVGLYKDGLWRFRDANDDSAPVVQFVFGPQESGWAALTGDWDGDGVDGIGLYKDGMFILRIVASSGTQDMMFIFGQREAGWQPIVGDWNGDGIDTIGVYKDGLMLLSNTNTNSNPAYRFRLDDGTQDWLVIAGDWDGSGADSVGLYRNGRFYLTNNLDGTGLRAAINFGPPQSGWYPIAGDWDANGTHTIGVYNMSIWRLRNSNSSGNSDIGFNFGVQQAGWQPLTSYRGGAAPLAALAIQPNVNVQAFEQGVVATVTPIPIEPTVQASATTEADVTSIESITPEVTEETITVPDVPEVTPELTEEATATSLPTGEVTIEPTTPEPSSTPTVQTPTETSSPTVEPVATEETTQEVSPP